jgi:hypothetical protein
MESLNLLKQEINETIEAERDFSKWKLIVTAAIGAAALGLGTGSHPLYWLLLLIPFACAYIDLHLCQLQLRILVLAQFIREYPASGTPPDTTLQDYEKRCGDLRSGMPRVFNLGQSASRIASLGLSLVAPAIILAPSWHAAAKLSCRFWLGFGIIWAIGVVLIWLLWSSQKRRLHQLESAKFDRSTGSPK